MIIAGYVLAILVGLSLGLLGGGGSILTVPILKYIMGMEAQEAIASSLVIVALTSLAALLPHWRDKQVSFRVGLPFGLASMAGAFLGGWTAQFIPGFVLMSLFAVIMIATSFNMIRGKSRVSDEKAEPKLWVSLLIGGRRRCRHGIGRGRWWIPDRASPRGVCRIVYASSHRDFATDDRNEKRRCPGWTRLCGQH
jgi:hypothetical protein